MPVELRPVRWRAMVRPARALTLDLDRVPWRAWRGVLERWMVQRWMEALALLGYRLAGYACRPSHSGNTHGWVWVDPEPRDCRERVRLQLLLGSDPFRELRNWLRCGSQPYMILFEAKRPGARVTWLEIPGWLFDGSR